MSDFEFKDVAPDFDDHILRSIPGYATLVDRCCELAQRYALNGTTVADIGCTTGRVLKKVRNAVQENRPDVWYLGIDREAAFLPYWTRRRPRQMAFLAEDAVNCGRMANLSMALSLFTVQFLPATDKRTLLGQIFDGLVPGGALIIAEKVHADTGRIQDALTFGYYDRKRRAGFTPDQIMDKERALRGVMHPWTEAEFSAALADAGFRETETIWSDFPFLAKLAIKPQLPEK
jgi:tRNA (cmo5U34)-methyltransferase